MQLRMSPLLNQILKILFFPDFGEWPESKLAILAEGFVVERGKLAKVRAPSLKPAPASVRPLADSRARWGLADK